MNKADTPTETPISVDSTVQNEGYNSGSIYHVLKYHTSYLSDDKLNALINIFGSDKIEDVSWLHDSDILSCNAITKIESRKICAIFKYYKDHHCLTEKLEDIFENNKPREKVTPWNDP